MTIQRISHKEDSYKNFRRNILGSCIDPKYFFRDDANDNNCDIHYSFDYGFLTALEKIKFELTLLEHLHNNSVINTHDYFNKVHELFHERLEITYGKNQDEIRGIKMQTLINQQSNRISDDL